MGMRNCEGAFSYKHNRGHRSRQPQPGSNAEEMAVLGGAGWVLPIPGGEG